MSYSVVNLDASETLNIRTDIHRVYNYKDGQVFGSIPSGADTVEATGLSIMLNGSRWREVRYEGMTGWVNASYLKRNWTLDRTPKELSCFGTEPFWGMAIVAERAEFTDIDEVKSQFTKLSMKPGQNRSNLWEYRWSKEGGSSTLTGLVTETDICSDGMSQLDYAYEIFLLGLHPGDGPTQGCCSIPLK